MVRTLEDIDNICIGGMLDVMPPAVAQAQFDIIEDALGPCWREVPATKAGLDQLLPENATDEDQIVASLGGLRLYQSCRSAILKLIISLAPTDMSDNFRTLRVLGQEANVGSGLTDIRVPLERAFGVGIDPFEITREMAVKADASLSGKNRNRLRRTFLILDRLRALPKVSERGLLPAKSIGAMPKFRRNGRLEIPFPPRIAAFNANLGQNDRHSLRAIYNAAIDAQMFAEQGDIDPSRLIERHTITKISEQLRMDKTEPTSRIYLNRVIKAVLDYCPSAHHPDAWEDLRRVAARAGFVPKLDPLHYLKSRCPGCAPHEITQEIFDTVLVGEVTVYKKVRLRRAGAIVNELRALQNENLQVLLPPADLIIPQRKRKPASPILPQDLWVDVIELAKTAGLNRDQIHAIGAIRQKASLQGLGPCEITHQWACEVVLNISAATTRLRFRRGAECLDAMRAVGTGLALLPKVDLCPLPDRRRKGNAMLPDRLVREIEDYAKFRGLSHNATRSILTSITTVFNKARKKEMFELPLATIPLADIVDEISRSNTELPRGWERISATACQLERDARFAWKSDWAELQRRTVAAGVPVRENPVPAIAEAAQKFGLEPTQVDREWAWQHGRSLRSDLKITWRRNAERFDALRNNPAIKSSGLLPPNPLGPMPTTGNRARHDIYPLPVEIENILESFGESALGYSRKQLRETTCFVWRYAREAGCFGRGDAPTAQQLLSDQTLNHILKNGNHGLQRRAFMEHRRRSERMLQALYSSSLIFNFEDDKCPNSYSHGSCFPSRCCWRRAEVPRMLQSPCRGRKS